MKKILFSSILMMMLTIVSCVDKDFDEPPIGGIDPAGLYANTTIAQLKANFGGAGTVKPLPDSIIVAGIVISSDETGNFYKDLVIEDSTGGVLIRVDRGSTYTLMPVGRRIFVKCAGLFIGDYHNLIQIGVKDVSGTTPSIGRIPDLLIDQHLIRGQWGQTVKLKVFEDATLIDDNLDQNTLIRLDNVHFDPADVCATWADMINQASANRTLVDKNGKKITVRSSNYATWGGDYIPKGTGSVVAVSQVYGTTKQLILRDLKDVVGFSTNGCTPVSTTPIHTIAALRALYSGISVTIPAGSDIEGIVISDKDFLNITTNNIVLQDATGGMTVRFSGANTFAIGTKVHIDLSSQLLYNYNGLMEVINTAPSTGIPNTLATSIGTGTITPRVTTISDLIANGEAWESTLVKILNVQITGPTPNYVDASVSPVNSVTTLTDPTGTVALYTRSQAIFSGTAYPTTTVSVTAIVSDYTSGRQLNIRNVTDVTP